MLRERLLPHEGAGGSPVVVASVMSVGTGVRYGNAPELGMISAPEHWSFAGATSGQAGGDPGTAGAISRSLEAPSADGSAAGGPEPSERGPASGVSEGWLASPALAPLSSIRVAPPVSPRIDTLCVMIGRGVE